MPSLGLVFLLVRIKHLLHISMVQWGFSDEGSVVRGLQQNGVLAGRGGGLPHRGSEMKHIKSSPR